MAHEIVHIEKGSIADRLGLREGDALAKINGETLIDQIDYQALTAPKPLRAGGDSPGRAGRPPHCP